MTGHLKVGTVASVKGYAEPYNGCRVKVISRDGEYYTVKLLSPVSPRNSMILYLYLCELDAEHT